MAADLPGISLALSLHAPNQELRQSIVPSAKVPALDRQGRVSSLLSQSATRTFRTSQVNSQLLLRRARHTPWTG